VLICLVELESVALSGGYEDDEDHVDWFLYTRRFDNYKSILYYFLLSSHIYVSLY